MLHVVKLKMHEFDLIQQLSRFDSNDPNIKLGIGDDAAILSIPQDCDLAASIDTLVEGVHFPRQTVADAIAYKAVSVNVSDIAAMGAKPHWVTLSLTLPSIEDSWIESFQQGLQRALNDYQISLVGGDISRGPLSVTIQAQGIIAKDQALKRINENYSY